MESIAKKSPLVSIIMCLYNAEAYVKESLESILQQTYQNLEVIVVNDGSKDNGPAIVKQIADLDNRVKLIEQENKGQCAASNAGYKVSTGTYIKFFDSDDILSPDSIKNQVEVLLGKSETEGSFIDYIRFYDDDLSTTNRYKLPDLINVDCKPIEYIKFHGTPQMYNNALWLFHRNIFERTGLWDERLSVNNDGEFFPRVLKHITRLYYAPNSRVFYRTNFNSGSLSQTVSKKGLESALLSVDLMASHVRSIENSDIVEKIIAQSYVQVLEISYPFDKSITRLVENRLKSFDRSFYTFSKSGPFYNIIVKFFGWKFAKQLQLKFYQMKYRNRNKVPH